MYIVTVWFTIHEAHWSDFMNAMLSNAKISLEIERGCRQFDVCVQVHKAHQIFLYEVYDKQADFEEHLQSPHFLQFSAQTSSWVSEKKVQAWTRVET